jgi:general secretion pathway protein I
VNFRRRCRAYTLIEVLVALMILALSLSVIFRIFGGGLHKIAVASEYSRAIMTAESVLAATGTMEILQPGESGGNLFDKYRWVRTISPYQAVGEPSYDNLPLRIYRVSVVVDWPGARGNRSIVLSTLKLEPRR